MSVGHSSGVYAVLITAAVLVTAQRLILCWLQLRIADCVGHSSEANAALVTAQRFMLCWSQLGDLYCVGHSSEVYVVLVRAYAALVVAQRLIL